MPDIFNVRIYPLGNWAGPIHTFPQGNTDLNTLACSDPGNAGRAAQFAVGTRYNIAYQIQGSGNEQRWEADCKYEPGGSAGVEFEEMEIQD
jgi:hypothetical protein